MASSWARRTAPSRRARWRVSSAAGASRCWAIQTWTHSENCFHAGTINRTKAEEAFCDRLRAELDVLRQKHEQCAFVVYTVGNAEQKAKAALYLKIMGYEVE